MHPVALASGQLPHFLLLVRPLEVELGDVRPALHLAPAQFHLVLAAADFLPHGLGGIEGVPRLVHIAQHHGLAHAQGAAVGPFGAGDHAQQGRLAGAVGADDADDAAGRQAEAQVLDQQRLAVPLAQMLGLDRQVAEPGTRRNDDLGGSQLLLRGLGEQGLVGRDSRLALGLAGAGRRPDPFQFALEDPLAGALLTFLLGQAFLFLFQPRGVVALVGDAAATVQFQDPPRDVVEEVAVVGDDHYRALVLLEEAFQPGYGLRVQVVGGLVQEQDTGTLEQQPAQRHPAPLAAGDRGHVGVPGRTAQGVHGDLQGALQLPAAGGVYAFLQLPLFGQQGGHRVVVHGLGETGADLVEAVEQRLGFAQPLHDVAFHVLGRVQPGLLFQVSHAHAFGGPRLAAEIRVQAGHDLEQRRLARAVHP